MGKITPPEKQKSWSEVNKTRREEKRKWKEQNLNKKRQKEALKSQVKAAEEVATTKISTISTISMAVPGSILENAQSPELRTYLAGQIARAACIFQIDEIIVFDDFGDQAGSRKGTLEDNYGLKTIRQCCVQLGRILQYLECPQYLRKSFFPIHNDLKFSGVLNPLNAPHHLSKDEDFPFREGVVQNKQIKEGRGSIVNVGLLKDVHVDKQLTSGVRCTVKLQPELETPKKLKGIIVSPSTPRNETGVYWGYKVRLATSLSKVFSQCPFKDGYDLTIGTSDKGTSVDDFECTPYKNLLVVFGGLYGLEAALESDSILKVDDPKLLFDFYLNTLPEQGSKTIRTEEAVLVSLAALRSKLTPENRPKTLESSKSGSEEVAKNDLDRFD